MCGGTAYLEALSRAERRSGLVLHIRPEDGNYNVFRIVDILNIRRG
jgi:hypothetical protein